MNDLRTVVGGLLSGLAEARALSDNIAKQIAVSYESDDLLRLFPVPRIDFSSVEADISVVLQDLEQVQPQPPADQLPQAPPPDPEQLADELLQFTYKILDLSMNHRSKQGRLYHDIAETYQKRLAEFAEAIKRTETQPVPAIPRLQIGATAGELEKAPPAAIGRIKMNVGVQNYEWVEVDKGADGQPIRRLTPTGR